MASAAPPAAARLVREPLGSLADPLAAARWLRGEPGAVALAGEWASGRVLLASHPLALHDEGDPFALLDAQPQVLGDRDPDCVGGGWLGWLGFGAGRLLERLPPPPPRPLSLPDFQLGFYDHVVRCDADGAWWFEALWTRARAGALAQHLALWRERFAQPLPPALPVAVGELAACAPGLEGHRAAVAEAIERIAAGEVFEVNVCLRFEAALEGDALDLWIAGAGAASPAHAAYVAGPGHAIASLSPERFLRLDGRRVTSEPIKGTAPGASDPRALAASAKDRAENVMIVDLVRNDLGRVCEYGSVTVPELCAVRPAAGVWHLVSRVEGRLREGCGAGELLRASFPPGSVTGAPKVQALRVISQLEASAREAYCGAIGVCSPLSGLELNVAIRTFESAAGRVWLGAGGGIVSDSTPGREVAEALAKADGVARAAGLRLAAPAPLRAGSLPPLTRSPRPDPARGLLETLAVSAGAAHGAGAHLARLRRSAADLGIAVPDWLEGAVADAAEALDEGFVRVVIAGDEPQIATGPLPSRDAVALQPVVLPGGLGAHKWADRRLVDRLAGPGASVLICDLDGEVLEAGHAAVLIAERGRLLAPELDARRLPSLSRGRTLRAAAAAGFEVAFAPLTLARLRAADAIVLTSALRGPHPGLLAGARDSTESARLCRRLAVAYDSRPAAGSAVPA
jgi:para-aminobenzoate synthetase/4-amino-4-deoxychorismate lyase